MEEKNYIIILALIGFAVLGMAIMPSITKKTNISYSVIYVVAGFIIYSLFDFLPDPIPTQHPSITEHLTELVVIVSIMGTGLKIDQRFSFKRWLIPFRLITITMILSIASFALVAKFLLHFDWATSILLGAVLAPTDPVLASDVQVGPPMERHKDNVKFSLSAEAGMNDGMAFPFVWLAIIMASAGSSDLSRLGEWFLMDVFYKIIAGVICGYLMGRGIAFLIFDYQKRKNFIVINDGFIAIAATLFVFGLTEMINGYGFMAVFVAAITIRNYELKNEFHKYLHEFTDQIERILVAIILLLFGGSLAEGILGSLTWPIAAAGIIFILFIRPLTSWVGLVGTPLHSKEKWGISFFGIKGIGSFYYLSFALLHAQFGNENKLWTLVAFIVLLSIIIHGLTATYVMKKLKDEFAKKSEIHMPD